MQARLYAAIFCTASFLRLPAQDLPAIRTEVHVVEVTMVARDSKGRLPRNLVVSDFRAWDNGKEQVVTSVELISAMGRREVSEPPLGMDSNRLGADRRPQVISMILLDGLNTPLRQQPRTRHQVARILSEIMPDERVAIFSLGNTLRTIHAFSSDRASLVAKLALYRGEVASLNPEDKPGEDIDDLFAPAVRSELRNSSEEQKRKYRRTFEALEQLANQVKSIPGRKNLLWLSGAFPMVVGMPFQEASAQGKIFSEALASRVGSPYKYLDLFSKEMDRTARALNAANVAVYPIDSRGLSSTPMASLNQGTMITLARETGGKAYYNRNDIDHSVRLALDDARDTYLLTFSPKGLLRDGAFHEIRVRSTRPGVQLRYRRGYYAPLAEQTVD